MKTLLKIFLPSILLLHFNTHADAFDQGSSTATLSIGSGTFFSENYLIIGAGYGYFLSDGLEVALEIDAWTGGTPSVYEVTPKLTYIWDNPSDVKPYFGAFFNRTFIEERDDYDALGYRAGFYSPTVGRAHIGVGIVYTELLDCTETLFNDCTDTRTELSLIFRL